jgi:HSP20 family protein
MTGLIRWNPESDLLRSRVDRLFSQMLQDVWGNAPSEEVSTRRWSPAVDIRETSDALILTAEVPGLAKDDLSITVENNVLTIAGERKFEKETQEESYHRMERSYGAFSRSFTLPANVRGDKVDAGFENGLLTVKLPKAEESKPRKITIK